MAKKTFSFTMVFFLCFFSLFSLGFSEGLSSQPPFLSEKQINEEILFLAQNAYLSYLHKESIKPLADLMDYLRIYYNFLQPPYQSIFSKTLFAINQQQYIQKTFTLSDPKRPKVRPIEDFIAQLCASIIGDYSFTPTYLTNLQPGENHITKAGTHTDTSAPIPLNYVLDSAKQMYLEVWKYPKRGSLSHYGQIACTGLLTTIAGSYYQEDRQVSTVVKYLYHDAKKFSKEMGLPIEKNHLPSFKQGKEVPIGAAVFNKPAFTSPNHVALCVGEMITYDLKYIPNAAIQSAVEQGLSLVDLDSKSVYYANNTKNKTTTLYCYGYLPKFEYLPGNNIYQVKN